MLRGVIPRWYTYLSDDNADQLGDQLHRLFDLRRDWLPNVWRLRSRRDVGFCAAEAVRYLVLRRFKRKAIIKDPFALFAAPWLARKFDMRVVVSIRHPAAVVSSFQRLKWDARPEHIADQPQLMQDLLPEFEREAHDVLAQNPDLVERAALLWKLQYAAVDVYRRRYPEWLFVKHEDLSRNPAGGFESICRHVKLAFTPGVRRRALATDDKKLPAEIAVTRAFTVKRNSAANIHNFRSRLTPSDLRRIRRRVEDVSCRFYDDASWE